MLHNFGKKDKDGQGRNRRGNVRYFRFGRKRASAEPERSNINCICPQCGLSAPHRQGMPCFELRCPQCGSKMARRFIG